jgi:multiple sugar transport system ATP-binding protein
MGFALKISGMKKDEIRTRVEEAARILDLEQYLDRKPKALSGGQRQRVAMGRAIVRNPQAFLMDEPLSNLDAKLRVQMRTQVSRLQKQLATTTVYVTHDQTEAMTLGDRVVVMRGGYIQQVGDPQTLYDNPLNLFVAGFIGSPSMNFLAVTLEDGKLRTPLGDLPLGDRLRRTLTAADAPNQLILGIRPEHFEDASLIEEHQRARGFEFTAPVDLVESMGSDKYVYLTVEGDHAASADLEDLAADAGGADLPPQDSLVTRLSAESRVRDGREARVWMNLDKIHLFDPGDGRNITLEEGQAAGVATS